MTSLPSLQRQSVLLLSVPHSIAYRSKTIVNACTAIAGTDAAFKISACSTTIIDIQIFLNTECGGEAFLTIGVANGECTNFFDNHSISIACNCCA